MDLQKICFVVPLFLATPVSIGLICYDNFKHEMGDMWFPLGISKGEMFPEDNERWYCLVAMGFVFWLAEVTSLAVQMFVSQPFLMAREEVLFWLPSYEGNLVLHV